jgi:thymidine phosphorylase
MEGRGKHFVELVKARDGDANASEKIGSVHRSPIIRPLLVNDERHRKKDGRGTNWACFSLTWGGKLAMRSISQSAFGIMKTGERVDLDEPLLFVHARNGQSLQSVMPLLEKAIEVS